MGAGQGESAGSPRRTGCSRVWQFPRPAPHPAPRPHLEALRELVGLEVGGRVLVRHQRLQDGADLGDVQRGGEGEEGTSVGGAQVGGHGHTTRTKPKASTNDTALWYTSRVGPLSPQ